MHYAAFLRAINVGKHNRVKMEELRSLCTSLGFTNVSTYLQTGNIVFESHDPEETAAVQLERALIGIGLRNAAVVVRTSEDLAELATSDPFADYDPARFGRFVTLLNRPLPPGAEVVIPQGRLSLVELRRREVLTVVELGGTGSFDLNGYFERKFKLQATTRYWRVVQALGALMPPLGD